jgi:hypothetical protein
MVATAAGGKGQFEGLVLIVHYPGLGRRVKGRGAFPQWGMVVDHGMVNGI